MKEQMRHCALGLLSLGLAASFSLPAAAQMFDDDDDVIEERYMIDEPARAVEEVDDDDDEVRVVYRSAVYRDGMQRCAETFRSFDPNAGTYVTYQGEVRVCPYLQ